jgi:hypothetical protein
MIGISLPGEWGVDFLGSDREYQHAEVTMNRQLNRTQYLLITLLGVILIAIVAPITFLDPQRYSAFVGGIQALGILIALILATQTLRADRHDRQVDRVLALHSEFAAGEIRAARARLIDHLRKQGGGRYIQGATRDDLDKDPRLASYDGNAEHVPFHDAQVVLRFFERANTVIKAKAVYEPLFHELIIRHAFWWELALLPSSTPWIGREDLHELASWGHLYARAHAANLEYLASWRANRERDFGHRRNGYPADP